MKLYVVVFILVVVAGFSLIGLIVCHSFSILPQHELKTEVYLNTKNMIEVDNVVVNSATNPVIIAAYPANHKNIVDNKIPWADLFVCVKANKLDSLKMDTLLLLDTHTVNYSDLGEVTKYWAEIKPAAMLNGCTILVPGSQIKTLTRYPYNYCRVQLVTDD